MTVPSGERERGSPRTGPNGDTRNELFAQGLQETDDFGGHRAVREIVENVVVRAANQHATRAVRGAR
ncbi:hypothetical protein [Streptomyces sp. NPDC060243]|uniref:hypothetical protein n=1 Tax=unclassified Streptomyces TaxID=2593676 RepID=UPI00366A2CDF